MMVSYLKNASNMLAIGWAVCTGNILQLNLALTFDDINITRYNSFQRIFLRNLPRNNQ